MATSEEIKKQIQTFVPEPVEDDDYNSPYIDTQGVEIESEPEIDLSETEEEEQEIREETEIPISEQPFDSPIAEHLRQEKLRRQERKQFEEMDMNEKVAYAKEYGIPEDVLPSSPAPTAEQEQAIANDLLNRDFWALSDKFDRVRPGLVNQFHTDLSLGKFQIPNDPDWLLLQDPLKEAFLLWLDRSNTLATLNSEQTKAIWEKAKEPLPTRLKNYLHPDSIKPKPKKQRDRTYKMPTISPEDMVEMLRDFAKKHPEKFRGGKR